MAEEKENSEIKQFYSNSTIFLTGGTGFAGKVIVSKLLLACDVSCIYLMIRKKGSKSGIDRVRELFQDPVFVHLKSKLPECENRIKLIEGDCALENLGLSRENEETLCKSVNFIIHCAASMNLVGSLKQAVTVNILGTKNLVNLANKMIHLKSFVYVSSLGAHMERDVIDEKLYKSHIEYEDFLNLLKIDHISPMDDLDEKKIIGNKLTNYTLTKAAAENIFAREEISVPVIIFRCGFLLPCWKEPIAGWIDNLYGPNMLLAASILDVSPFIYCKDSNTGELAPVDLAANALIVAIPFFFDQFHKEKENCEVIQPFVFNYSVKKQENLLRLSDILRYLKNEFNSYPIVCSDKIIFVIWNTLFGLIPALMIDVYATISRKESKAFQTCRNLMKVNLILNGGNAHYEVINSSVRRCWKNLNHVDKKLFSFDINEINWDEYLPLYVNAIREHLKTPSNLNKKIKLLAFWIPKVMYCLKTLYCMLCMYIVYIIYTWMW